MNRNLGGLAACAALAMAASAQANVKWTVSGATFAGGDVEIDGYFTQDGNGTAIDYSLSATGVDTFTLDPTNSHFDGAGSNNVNFSGDNGDYIALVFTDDLLVANNPLSIGSSYIYYNEPASRTFGYTDGTGSATGQVLGVPEPAGWALMLGGVFGVGGLARRRRPALDHA